MGNIHIGDLTRYNDKIESISAGSIEVVADFDHTMTASRRVSASCFGLLASMPRIDGQFSVDRSALFDEYHPHEMNRNYTKAERDRWMKEWWTKAMQLHHKHKVRQSDIASIDFRRAVIRSGWREFLHICESRNVPVHVLSAGITQIIESILSQNNVEKRNLDITSNRLLFDELGNYIGAIPSEPIHTGNKSLHKRRKGEKVVLFGDSIDDVHMAEGVPEQDILRVAFYNPESQVTPEDYLKVFDVVIESGDGDEGFLGEIVKKMR